MSTYDGKHDKRPTFADLAKDSGTDKVTDHNYAVLYDKYLPAFRDSHVKMLEIGLGCGMVSLGSYISSPSASLHHRSRTVPAPRSRLGSSTSPNWRSTSLSTTRLVARHGLPSILRRRSTSATRPIRLSSTQRVPLPRPMVS